MGYRVGIDVGGTFTDFALLNETSGELMIGKALTTPDDPSVAVLEGLDRIAGEAGISMGAVVQVSHATTIATNTVIQRSGPDTALLTTEGFRDILLIGRQKRWELYDNAIDKPVPLVPRRHIWEVPERLLYDGSVYKPLDEDAAREAIREMKQAGLKSVGVCFLHSYVNPQHERRVAAIFAEEAPEIDVTLSSDISPIYREYERASTTVLNAYVVPAVSAYIHRLEEGLRARDYDRTLYIMQSNGGVASPEIVRKSPIRIIESGPAAGVLTAARYKAAAGRDNIFSFDMGGTTAKFCLLEAGKPTLSNQFEVDMVHLKRNSGLPITIPAIDLVEIGAGGGSIASVEMGAIVVGPESAGSDPGPICYGRGGERPTVTDADLLLGYLNPDYFLGGQMTLDERAARKGVEAQVATPLGMGVTEAAWGIHEVVTSQMAQAARVVSVGRGKDPRHFALIPFGGAGPVHGARLARMLGCPRVVFPKGAGVESAIGLLAAEPVFDLARTQIMALREDNLDSIRTVYEALEQEGRDQVERCRPEGEVVIRRSADMRFAGQGYEIEVALPDGGFGPGSIEAMRKTFFADYAKTYGDRTFDEADTVEAVHWRVSATTGQPGLSAELLPDANDDAARALKGERQVYFPDTGGFTSCKVYDRYRLAAGDCIIGPAVVEERESTVVILPHSRAEVDAEGNIAVDLEDE